MGGPEVGGLRMTRRDRMCLFSESVTGETIEINGEVDTVWDALALCERFMRGAGFNFEGSLLISGARHPIPDHCISSELPTINFGSNHKI